MSSKDRYERAVAARRAREERARDEAARARAEREAADHSYAVRNQTVLGPPDPNRSGGRQLAGILGAMLLIALVISAIATFWG